MNISKRQVENYYFGNPESIANKMLFIKRDARLAEYKQRLTQIHEFGNVWHGLTGKLHGQDITIIVTGTAPSQAGDAVYALDRPHSICLRSGTCGGLQADLQIGDYFVARQAVCGDGYSFLLGHAPLEEISGDSNLLAAVQGCIAGKTERCFQGTTFTTSSVVREVDADFWKIVAAKCQVIEMSAAAFYAAAIATHKKAATYFWISDLPRRGKSFFESLDVQDMQNKQRRYAEIVELDLELLSCL